MKPLLTILGLVGFLCSSVPARSAVQDRRLQDINVISTRVLQRSISPKFYKSLLISPVEGWIVVRANVINTRMSGARVIRSELNGAYDQLALKLADDMEISGYFGVERPSCGGAVLLHLLIYQIADGTMVLFFPTLDEPGGNQMSYWGCARLGVLKSGGKWVEIEGPEGLHGKGWMVRPADRSQMPRGGYKSAYGLPPREKKYRPGLPPPPSSVLEPIVASTKK
jgi:hypothetical protein